MRSVLHESTTPRAPALLATLSPRAASTPLPIAIPRRRAAVPHASRRGAWVPARLARRRAQNRRGRFWTSDHRALRPTAAPQCTPSTARRTLAACAPRRPHTATDSWPRQQEPRSLPARGPRHVDPWLLRYVPKATPKRRVTMIEARTNAARCFSFSSILFVSLRSECARPRTLGGMCRTIRAL